MTTLRRADDAAVGHRDRPQVAVRAELLDLAQEGVLAAEGPRLLERPVGEVRAADAAREAGVVADERGRAGLPAHRGLLDHHRREPLGGRVHRRRQAARARAHHDDVVDVVRRQGAHQPEGIGDLEVGGRDEGRGRVGEGELEHGELGVGEAEPGQQAVGGLRADLVEADGDVVAPELVPQRVGALVALLADHPHRLEADALGEVPVVQRVGDRAVELLVAPALGPQEDELGVPVGDGGEHVAGAGEVAPDRGDRPLGRRVQRVGAAQEVEAAAVVGAEAGDHERHLPSPPAQPLEHRAGVLVARADDHLVVASVPAPQLRPQHVPRRLVGRCEQQDGIDVAHGGPPSSLHIGFDATPGPPRAATPFLGVWTAAGADGQRVGRCVGTLIRGPRRGRDRPPAIAMAAARPRCGR